MPGLQLLLNGVDLPVELTQVVEQALEQLSGPWR
jgi:hypothetical protein